MSIGPSIGIIGGIAAVPAVQRGVASDAASTETARQQGEIKNDLSAAEAAGIGKTDGEQHETNERDADGRLDYDFQRNRKPNSDSNSQNQSSSTPEEPHLSKDLTGDSGGSLDLLG